MRTRRLRDPPIDDPQFQPHVKTENERHLQKQGVGKREGQCGGGGGGKGGADFKIVAVCIRSKNGPPIEDPPIEDPPIKDPPFNDPPIEDPPIEDQQNENPPIEHPLAESGSAD